MRYQRAKNLDTLSYSTFREWIEDIVISDIPNRDKLLCLLAGFDEPQRVRDLRAYGISVGFRRLRSLNVSDILRKSAPFTVNLPDGWKLTNSGYEYLRNHGLNVSHAPDPKPVASLRSASEALPDLRTQTFVREAVTCHEHGLYRAAVIMSWIGAVSMLQGHVFDRHLGRFNEVAFEKERKWSQAKTTDDLSRLGESRFLDRLTDISVISSDVKKELGRCLDRRNSCSHPNSYVIGEQTSAHHLEVLINNVFARVCSLCN